MNVRSGKTTSRDLAEADFWEDRAALVKAIAHPVRLQILEALSEGAKCVKDLNALVAIPQPHLSQHMAVLRKIRLVDSHSDGTLRCYYLLQPTLVRPLMRLLRKEHPVRFRKKEDVQKERRRKGRLNESSG